jgi:hypothetical protein
MGAYYTEQENFEDFSIVLSNVRGLMDLYLRYIFKQAEAGDKIITEPNRYTLVRAIDIFFCNQDMSSTVGTCLVVEQKDTTTLQILPVKHYWLTWRNIYIIDVLPVDGRFGLSLPAPVFETHLPKRFRSTGGMYESSWSRPVRDLADKAVEELVSVFDSSLQKVSS